MDLGPITLEPILVSKPWGGRRLAVLGRVLPGAGLFGESWDIADLPAGAVQSSDVSRTPVASGWLAGRTLHQLISELGSSLLGSARPTPGGDFPLLVKYLDAQQHLSVQVHPDESYVTVHPGTHLKTESWYVVDAEPDSFLYIGLRDGVQRGDVEACLGTAALVDLLQQIPARRGDFHHLPAGIVHALGAGVIVAEPQTPSDTTFRLYDWSQEYGRAARTLHLQAGLESLHVEAAPVSLGPIDTDGRRELVATPYYSVVEHQSSIGTVEIDDRPELRILMVTAGEVIISLHDRVPERVTAGRTVLIPAQVASGLDMDVVAPARLLEIALV